MGGQRGAKPKMGGHGPLDPLGAATAPAGQPMSSAIAEEFQKASVVLWEWAYASRPMAIAQQNRICRA